MWLNKKTKMMLTNVIYLNRKFCLLNLFYFLKNNFDFEDLRRCERKEGEKRDGDYFEIQVPLI